MSASTALILVGLLIAAAGAGGALLAHYQPDRTRPGAVGDELALATDFEGMARALHAIDRRIKIGVGVAVGGLLLAGIGAYLGSDARALGADVGGGGSNDNARVGGSW